jgi:hypothetical protein
MVAVNLLGRDFWELTGPLAFFQVAPLGFLWIERGFLEALGASEWSLRLGPILCGLAAVPIFAWLATRALGGKAALLAVAVFAVSHAPIRHAAEVKPYAFDLLAALVLLGPSLAWLRRPEQSGWIWLLVLAGPVALACSLPAVFVAGGIGLSLSPAVWELARERPGTRIRTAWLLYLSAVPLAFVGLYLLSLGEQSEAVRVVYREGYWSDEFPPMGDPLRLVGWLVSTHAGAGFGYPIGGERGASVVSTILASVGIIALIRQGDRRLTALLLTPIGLTLLASVLGRYPYGGSARTMQHVAPAVCLLIGAGGAALIDRIPRPTRRRGVLIATLATLGVIGTGILALDLARPYRTVEDQRTRDFARWFWPEVARGAEVGCVRAMRGTTFDGFYWRLGRLELYLANRELNLPADRDPARPRLDRVSHDRPLRCVLYNEEPEGDPALASWLGGMQERFRLREVRPYTVNGGVEDRGMPREERFLVLEFVPREPIIAGSSPTPGGAR